MRKPFYDQSNFEIRCEWGSNGVEQLALISDVVVIVDVLSFSTCVEIANQQGAIVFPYPWKGKAAVFAKSVNAELASHRSVDSVFSQEHHELRYSLSPASLRQISAGTRLVLPSPNGSTLSLMTGDTPTLTGCLRNCEAVAIAAMKYGPRIAVIPAGERWEDGSLRPAFEDLIGAGAILSYLQGRCSPEAQGAIAAFRHAYPHLKLLVKQCGSGQELIGKGFEADIDLAVEFNVSTCVPRLVDQAYRC